MGSIFKLDSPFMNFLNKVADLMILNVLTLIFCIPVITAGASLTAMWSVLLKMVRHEEPPIMKSFFRSLKENFAQSTILWLIMCLFGVVLGIDYYMFIADTHGATFPIALRYAIIAVTVIVLLVAMYVFPLQSRFSNKVLATLRNAFFLSISQLPKTIVIGVIYVVTGLLYYALLGMIFPALFLLGLTVPCYFCAVLFQSIFKAFEPETEADTDEYRPLSIFMEGSEEKSVPNEEGSNQEDSSEEDSSNEETESAENTEQEEEVEEKE